MFPHSFNICNQPPIMYYFLMPNPIFSPYFATYQTQAPSHDQNINIRPIHHQQEGQKHTSPLHPHYFQKEHYTSNKPQVESEAQSEAQNFDDQLKEVKSRNILPNAINLILSFIRRVNKSGKIVKKMIEKFGDSHYSLKKYYSYQSYLKDSITNYTSKNILHLVITFCDPSCKIFNVDEQTFYNMVTRNLVLHFIKEDGLLALFTSKKEHKTLKTDHLKVYRFIINDLKRYQKKKLEHK